ncbi:MAG: hypothetical protein Q9170_000051 [Blastenia crenularia]
MDEATAETILSLQLNDLDRLLQSPYDGNTRPKPSDYRVVLGAYRAELTGRLDMLRDRRMGRSIAIAVVTDQNALATVRHQKNAAIRDQVNACDLDRELNQDRGEEVRNNAIVRRPAAFVDPTDGVKEPVIDRFTRINALRPDVIDLTTSVNPQRESASTTNWGAQARAGEHDTSGPHCQSSKGNIPPKRKGDGADDDTSGRMSKALKQDHSLASSDPRKRILDEVFGNDSDLPNKRFRYHGIFTGLEDPVTGVKKACVSCNESVHYFAAVYAPCGHDYCSECAKRLFTMSMKDESLFPPRCCRQPIPLAAVDVFFTAEFIQYFHEKGVEYTTVNKVYCAWPTCSAFIPPNEINSDIAQRPKRKAGSVATVAIGTWS